MKKLWAKIKRWFIEEEWRAFLALFIFLSLLYFPLRYLLNDNLSNELVEYVGLLLDVLFFGTIMGFYHSRTQRRKRIREYHEQLRDFWHWEDREGILRKTGILRRLGSLDNAYPHMSGISLNDAVLRRHDFSEITADSSKFTRSQISETTFTNAVIRSAYFQFVEAWGADFQDANLNHTSFEGAKLYEVNFSGASLKWVDFQNARLAGADFTGADVSGADFKHVDLLGTKGLTIGQLNTAETAGAILPEGLEHGQH